MITINRKSKIKILWKIWRGVNKISEDFNSLNTNLKVFLVGGCDTYAMGHVINREVEPGYDVIEIDVYPNTLTEGVYNLKALWTKNQGRDVLTSMRDGVFGITSNVGEAEVRNEEVRLVSMVESYGRDGMSAFETAVLRGVNNGYTSEKEWVDNFKVTGDIINNPDEEDITVVGNKLKLKDRQPSDGMGYVILRKNVPIKEQITLLNTIYEIRYTHDLEGETLAIPKGCTLRYNGGSLRNGKLVYSDTRIEGTERMENVTFEGNYDYAGEAPKLRFNKTNEVEVSYDKENTWKPISEPFETNIGIKGYVDDVASLPDNMPLGTSYGVKDVTFTAENPKYRVYVYTSGGWIDNGLFAGVSAGIVNDLTAGGADKALSAEMGKELKEIATDTIIIYALPVVYNQVPSTNIGADGDYALFLFTNSIQRLYKKINGAWTIFTDYKKVIVIAGNRVFYRENNDKAQAFTEISTPILDAVLSTIRVENTDIEPFDSMLYIWLEESTGWYRVYTYLNNSWKQIENNTTLSNVILKADGDFYKFHYSTHSLEKLSSNRLVELLEDKVNQVYENTIYADLISSKSGVMPGEGASNKEFYLNVDPSTTYRLKFKAQYTGQLTLYVSTDGTDNLGEILSISNTDFTSEFTTYITTPENCHVLRTRTHKAGVTIDYISLYLESPLGEIVGDIKERVEKIEEKQKVQPNDWQGKVISTYGDSVTALNGGDFNYPYDESAFGYKWALRVANYFQASSVKNRGIGGQRFNWHNNGGSVSWVNTETGEYVNRNDSYNYDNYVGNVTIPSNCTPIRGALSSWLRITSMYPESIKDAIDVVLVMAHNDMGFDATIDIEFVEGDSTDTEWANSSYYQTYGGDYNINTVKGGIASTIMKLQAWMPNAVIVLMTPISGRGEEGELNIELTSRMTEIVDAVKDVHNLMSIPCIDVYGTCGINGLNRTRYITDTIHPYSADGSKMVARAVICGMKGIIPNML